MSASNTVSVGELLLSDYNTRSDNLRFDSSALAQLYDKLVGGDNSGTYGKVKKLVSGDTYYVSSSYPLPVAVTAGQIRERNNNKDVLVTFGGLEWTVTYLTRDKNGNVIATLWLSNSDQIGRAHV